MYTIILLLQNWADQQSINTITTIPAQPSTTGLTVYVDVFANIMLAGAALLALMSSWRIYNNWHFGGTNIWRSVSNLVLGMVFFISLYIFITNTF